MNDEQDRPYLLCSAAGCSQRFLSDEPMVVHRRKHDMTLKFSSSKTDSVFTDQTPTPTRFLRSCEEVGLFKEIEEEFLQAEEEEKKKKLNLPVNISSCLNQQHLLHQAQGPLLPPHAQGPLHSSLMAPSCSLPSTQAGTVITHTPPALTHAGPLPGLHMRTRHRQPLPAAMPGNLPDHRAQGGTAQLLPMDSHMSAMMALPGPASHPACSASQTSFGLRRQPHVVAGGNHHGMASLAHMMEMMSHHQQAPPLPPVGYQRRSQAPPLSHPQTSPAGSGPSAPQSPPREGSSPGLSGSGPSPPPCPSQHALQLGVSGRRRRGLDQDPDERRQKFLERNRAAATRCRQKRKVWVSSLERKAEELTHTNMELQNEVTSLRSEVGQLKQILLTHKDCPVTARQRKAQGLPSE